jgi:hypothetical protein
MIQYAKYRSPEENRPRALLTFAGNAILDSVRERKRRWTWDFFAERRDDRRRYVKLFKKKQLNTTANEVRLLYFLRVCHSRDHRNRLSWRLWRRNCHMKIFGSTDQSHDRNSEKMAPFKNKLRKRGSGRLRRLPVGQVGSPAGVLRAQLRLRSHRKNRRSAI